MYGTTMNEIDRNIEYWNRVKNNYRGIQPNPINIFNNTNPNVVDFEARIIDANTDPVDIIVYRRTAFICFDKGIELQNIVG